MNDGTSDDAADVFAVKDRLGGIGVVQDPHPQLRALREQCPVHAGSISGSFGVVGPDNYLTPDGDQVSVFSFDEVDGAFRDHETFSNRYYQPFIREVLGRTILEMDPPDHQRYRSLLQGAFTKAEMVRWEESFVRHLVRTRLAALAPLGRADLAADFAFYYPISVMAAAAGLPVEHVDTFYDQATKLTNVAVDEADRLAASRDMAEMVGEVLAARRAEPRDDLISVLAAAELRQPDGAVEKLSDEEIVSFVRLLVPAGAQTTYRTLTNVVFALLGDPEQLALVRADPALIPRAIEEGLRWEAPLLSFGRIATHGTEIAGHPVPAGTTVNLCVHSANRDPSRWSDPDRFDLTRPPKGHLGFGQGNHVCLGIHFARMELRVAIESLLEMLPNLRLDPEAPDVVVGGLSSRAAVRLPCVWDPPEPPGADDHGQTDDHGQETQR